MAVELAVRAGVVAFLFSLALHALVAAALVFGHCRISRRVTSPELDVSKSDLTIVITETRPAPPMLKPLPAADAAPRRVAPKGEVPVPNDAAGRRVYDSQPPQPSQLSLPSPESLPAPDSASAVHPFSPPAVSPSPSARIDAPARPRQAIRPHYPRRARERGAEGDVTLEVEVGAEGSVAGVRLVSSCGHAELDEAAVEAVREARFVPAEAEGRRVDSTVRLTIRFKLR